MLCLHNLSTMKKLAQVKSLFLWVFVSLMFTLQAQPPAPATVTATVGTPASGAAHYLSVSWASSTGATSYELETSTDGNTWTNIYTGSALTFSHNTGNVADATFYYRVRASNGTASAYTNASQFPIRTACDAPAVPQFSAVTTNTTTLSLVAETPDANPSSTTYSIYCTTASQYVQANGTLGATEVFQTRAAWGNVLVTGLNPSTNYCFYAKARNSDGYVTVAQGSSITATETFTTAGNWSTSSSGSTSVYWSPNSCTTGPLSYISSGGCTGGYIGKTASWNSYFGCFLRTPATNCTGNTVAVVNFDLSNSYFANHPNDKIRFYMWVDNGYKDASAVKINGTNVGVIENGDMWLKFSQARTCVNVSVEFDLTTSSNLSNILFYLEPSCGYNDSQVFSVGIDNVSIQGQSAPTGCITTNACGVAAIASSTGNTNVCAGANTNFTVTTTGAVATYQWQVSTDNGGTWNNATGAPYTGDNTAQLTITGTTVGMSGYRYRCNVVGTCSGAPTSTPATLTVTNAALATPGTIFGNNSVCQNQTGVIYNVPAVSGATSYTWTLPTGVSATSGSTSNTITVSFGNSAISGNILVTASNNCNTSSASAPLAITVNSIPTVPSAITGSTSFCQGAQQTYSVPTVSGVTTYTWTLPNGWNGTSSTNTITATAGSTGGTISVTAGNNCGTSSAQSLLVNTNGAPAVPGTIGGTNNVCAGDTITYSIAAVSGASAYVWTLPNGWSGTSTTESIQVVAGNTAGNVSVASTSNCGTSANQSLAVSIKAVPALPTVTGAGAVCEGTTNAYTFNTDPNASGYIVTVPTGWSYAQQAGGVTVTVGAQSGNIQVTATNECGASTVTTTTVTVLPAPVVSITVPTAPVCSTAAPIQLAATPTGGTFGGNAVGGGFFNPSLAPLGSNQITYSYTDANNCSATDTVTIVTEICSGISEIEASIQVYPNPFSRKLVVNTAKANGAVLLTLTDVTGKLVMHTNVEGSITTFYIPAETAAGMYTLQVLGANHQMLASKKVVLQK